MQAKLKHGISNCTAAVSSIVKALIGASLVFALPGQAQDSSAASKKCVEFGFTPNTSSHAECVRRWLLDSGAAAAKKAKEEKAAGPYPKAPPAPVSDVSDVPASSPKLTPTTAPNPTAVTPPEEERNRQEKLRQTKLAKEAQRLQELREQERREAEIAKQIEALRLEQARRMAKLATPVPVPSGPSGGSAQQAAGPSAIKDCADCPEMVVIPPGSFAMGSSAAEQALANSAGLAVAASVPIWAQAAANFTSRENPLHRVNIRSFAAGRYAISKGEFATFVRAKGYQTEAERGGGCYAWNGKEWKNDKAYNWRNIGFAQADNHPVVCVSWNDAQAYIAWLNQSSGQTYRLLSEAEREYAARGGTQTAFWWGDSINTAQANYVGTAPSYDGSPKGEYRQATVPVNSFSPNPFGLYNVHGNVWEWTQDCWHENYSGAPTDGSAWTTACSSNARVLRGGSWIDYPALLRSAFRGRNTPDTRNIDSGLRLARTLLPGSAEPNLKAPEARPAEPEKSLPVPDTVRVLFEGREFAAELLEKRDFELAMALIRKSDFTAAQKAFFDFLTKYPKSGYAPSGLFWLGNAQYQTRDYKEAILNFRQMISTAPDHLRAPEAALSAANCQAELKDTRGARKTLDDLIKAYPASEAAGAAKERLKLLK